MTLSYDTVTMGPMEDARWTLDELAERVDAALAVDYAGQSSGRVRDVPDRRAIRWYTTIGLIDRPVAYEGRAARYGVRHLLQLVVVKRLQASGLSLVEIQQRLAGATDTQLARAARLPAAAGVPGLRGRSAPLAASGRGGALRQEGFWRRRPSASMALASAELADSPPPRDPAASQALSDTAVVPASSVPPAASPVAPASPVPLAPLVAPAAQASAGPPVSVDRTVARATVDPAISVVRGVRLGDGATLLLEPGPALGTEDLEAVLDAARPLLAALRARGLTGEPEGWPQPAPPTDPSAPTHRLSSRTDPLPEPRREHP